MVLDSVNSMEKRIRESAYGQSDNQPIPDFDKIKQRVASEEPVESYEEFFREDSFPTDSRPLRKVSGTVIAGTCAAAVLVILCGGILLKVMVSEMTVGKSSADSSQMYMMNDSMKEVSDSCENCEDNWVSDSDLQDSEYDDFSSQE